MYQLITLLAVLFVKMIAADDCISQVIAIFSGGYSGNELNILTKSQHFIVKKFQITNPPFLNLYYDTVEASPVSRQLSEQFASIIDIDHFQHKCYALKKEHKTVKLVKLDLETGQTFEEHTLTDPDVAHLKSFVILPGYFSFYFQLGDKAVVKNYSFILNEEKIQLHRIEGEQKEFQFDFNRVAYVPTKNSNLRYAFLRDLDLYLSKEPILKGNQTLDRYNVINVNRLTNCRSTLCAFKRIDGFLYYNDSSEDKSRHTAVMVNNNYFFASDIININGSTPVRHFPHYDRFKFASVCEVLFTIDRKNYCFRSKKFYNIEFVNGQFEIHVLVATTQDPFVDNFNLSPSEFLDKWLQFKERPVAVIKLFNKAAVLFPSNYTTWTADTKSYETKEYDNLFPNYDLENRIMHAFYDEPTKRYLFVGSKFSFIYRHSQLNEHNQFFENLIRLTQPLYTNCVEPHIEENSFTLSLILSIIICFILIILVIICIFLKHCRAVRTPFRTQASERPAGKVLPRSTSKSKRTSLS